MARRSALLLFFLLPVILARAASLDPLLSRPDLWSMPAAEFQTVGRSLNFEWTSAARDSARASGNELTIFGLPAVEAIARFDKEKLKELTVAIYARGDAGEISKEQYTTLIKTAVESLNRAAGVKFTPRGKDATNAVKADGVFWVTPKAHYLLEYSATKEVKSRSIPFRAEFVRLELTPPPKATGLLATASGAAGKTKFTGEQHVTRDATSGDVVITDVPMVDQGQKGYCVVASTERVMRYYGAQVDANELAQIANSDAEGGTSSDGMFLALKKIGARLKVRVRQLEESNVRSVLELVKDYNRAARKAGQPEIPDPGRMIDVGLIYSQMQFDILKEARSKSRVELTRFQREVQQHIDEGVPLLWSVQLGMVKERGIPQNAGGHMRLIVGYNSKTSEVLFSDSWGAGHEQKRMAMDDAWTITTGLSSIAPL